MVADHAFSGVNNETLPFVPESMQFGHVLERIIREILLANPAFGLGKMLKMDFSNGFYRLHLVPSDAPKLGLAFPRIPGQPDLVAIPLVLTMGWKNRPLAFCALAESTANVCNTGLAKDSALAPHPLDDAVEAVTPPLLDPLPQLRPCVASTAVPAERDPCLPRSGQPLQTVDVFDDDFVELAQEHRSKSPRKLQNSRRVRQILLHAVDDFLRPIDEDDNSFRREPASLKKLRKGNCSWCTVKEVLGWVIDTVTLTIYLPLHQVKRLGEILASIPVHQKRTSVKKWHKVLDKLRSMSLTMPGAGHLFSLMQQAIPKKIGGRVSLTKDIHQRRWRNFAGCSTASSPVRLGWLSLSPWRRRPKATTTPLARGRVECDSHPRPSNLKRVSPTI